MEKIKKWIKSWVIDASLKDDIKFLKKVALFQGLSDRALAKIALIMFKKTYSAGEEVFRAGQEANVVYIVKSGKVQITENDAEQVIEADDFFGGISLFENSKHDTTSKTLQDSELVLIYRIKLEDMIYSDYKAGFMIMKNFSKLFVGRSKSK